jgi:hypothetical protein
MKDVNRLWLLRGIGVIFISVLLVLACSDNKIMNISSQPVDQDLAAINAVDFAKTHAGENPGLASATPTYLVAKTEYGFEISGTALTTSFVLDNETITIQVPNNAFNKSKWGDRLYIYIRAEKWSTPNGNVFYYDCTPSGVVFNSPLKLNQPYQNKVSGKQSLYFYDPKLNQWVTADAESLINGKAKFEIGHFSKYAISD